MGGLLENKVVVISGVGPALGTTLARRCAEAGADLVLAARTESAEPTRTFVVRNVPVAWSAG